MSGSVLPPVQKHQESVDGSLWIPTGVNVQKSFKHLCDPD